MVTPEAHPVCQDRGAGGSVGVADRRAREAGPRRHARAAALSRPRRRRRRASADAAAAGRSAAAGRVLRAAPLGPRHAGTRRRPRVLRSRGTLRHVGRRLSRQRAAIRRVQPRRARVPAAARAAAVGHPRARLADRARARLSEDAAVVRPVRRRSARRLHDPQPGVSGRVSGVDAAGHRPRRSRCSTCRASSSGATSAT